MDPKQDNAALLERRPALDGNLPKVLIQSQHDARFGFGEIQKGGILSAGAIGSGPKHIVAIGAKHLDNRLREALVGEEAHLRRNRIGLVFVGQVAGVRQAGENILARQARIVCLDLVLGLTGREEFENELDGQTRPSDHWFAGHDLGVDDDALREGHNRSLPCQRTALEGVGRGLGGLFDWTWQSKPNIGGDWRSLVTLGDG